MWYAGHAVNLIGNATPQLAMPTLHKPLGFRKWVEPWYLAYALLGAAIAGIAPILLPLAVSRSGNIAAVGLVIAAFNLGGLAAPLWGDLTDRYRLHRWLMLGGLLVTAIALAAFPFTTSLAIWFVLALAQGAGASAAATVANLFVVEVHPRAEWDERIGWLQAFYGAGQVGGLLLAGMLSQAGLSIGLLTAAGLTVLAFFPAGLTPTPIHPSSPRPVLPHPSRHAQWSPGSPQQFYHRPSLTGLRRVVQSVNSAFSVFLLSWLLSFGGAAAFFSLYPMVMQHAYGVAPEFSSAGYAFAAALGLTLYAPAGRWSERFGALGLLRAALVVRVLAFLGLFVLGLTPFVAQGAPALLAFLLVVLAWSLLSVTGTALAARFSPMGEGEGIGTFNATTALAGVIGAALGGWLAGRWGYNAVSVMGIIGVVTGLILTGRITQSKVDK